MALISVIVPVFNEEKNLEALHDRLCRVAEEMEGCRLEFVFVDDCSSDGSPHILRRLRRADPRIELIRFSRNCGSHAAVAAGLGYCSGDAAVMIAADLQDPPELIPQLVEHWRQGYAVVWGVRKKREGEPLLTRLASRFFYSLMNRLTDVAQPPTGADVFFVDRCVIEAFRRAPEKNTSVYMLIAWLGFRQTRVPYVKAARHAGASKWTFSRRLKLFFDSLISFSYAPLRLMSAVGALLSVLGLFYGVVVFVNALLGRPIMGWSSLMIVVLVLGGTQMLLMGLLGEYLWRTFDETRGRPRYVIEQNTLAPEPKNPRGPGK